MAQQAGIGTGGELARTLRRLEVLAVRPVEELGAAAADELSRLQYSLHLLGERLVAHPELAETLVAARDATAEVAEVASSAGWAVAAPLVYEWRGALFRVRLARMSLAAAQPPPPAPQPESHPERAALTALLLTLAGGAAFVSGAVVAVWPLWVAGMLAVVAGLLVYRP